MRTHHLLKGLIVAASLTPTAQAAEGGAAWSTTSHLGFAVVDRSTTGFEKSTGSLVFADVERDAGARFSVGLRTVAQGAKTDGRSFYRLGAGPLVSLRATPNWLLQLAATRFDEMGKGDTGDTAYTSRGAAVQLGWERVFRFGPKVELAWGGFVTQHQGTLAVEPAAVGVQGDRNHGLSHGVEAALRVDL